MIDKTIVEHQRRRWMRPNAHLWIRPDAYRFMPRQRTALVRQGCGSLLLA
jgi:hypothetical protein